MSNIIVYFIISLIKFYKYFISPFFGNKCRFLPTCSDYFLESMKTYGLKGLIIGFKRLLKCHPIKKLGGSSGLDFVPTKENFEKGKK
tara:strand:- start:1483 stop:1743 length:261 start_codon:yes stop_codon:yes gene_type:complete